ncbi:MAG: DNA translocase FtsK 4TM domain-containing protein [Rhodobacteraceae bacterium]|nr:DNA translocase FtsK 4TM domain-containing protein [Paracoccaceae bacterium]
MAARSKAKRRAPLVESDTEEALRRRGTELLGLILLGLGALAFILIWTYSPDDPSLFNSTDAPPQNALGLVGAWIADPLFRALGWASYGIPAALMVWGSRLVLHAGETRAVSRALATPVAILAAAAFASTHVPLAGWPNDFGLGGMLGDAVLGNFLTLLPLGVRPALLTASFALGAVFIVTTAFALGVTLQEARRFLRYLRDGSITLYAGLHRLTGRAAKGVASGARSAQSYASERRARRAEETVAPPLPKPSRRSGGIPPFPARTEAEPMPAARPDEDGVMAKITAAVRARAEADAERTPVLRNTPPLSAGTETTAAAAAPRASLRAREPIPDFEVEDDDDEILIEPGESRVKKAGPKPSLRKSLRARAEEQPELALNGEVEMEEYAPPALSLLQHPDSIVRHVLSDEALEENARMLENVLDDYGVRGEIVSIRPGPVVTMYELEPAAGLKASRVIGLSDDIARSMSALACRVSTIPGRSVIGIELPNDHREKVLLREILAAKAYGDSTHALPLALGKDIGGEPVVANLARMPHLLIAGTTGSGKSVAVNTMILSLLYKLSPDECRLIMIDPKMLELSVYDGIPHLLSPVVTDPKKAVVALKWVVAEMEERYRKMSKMGVRNIDGYNARVRDALAKGEAFTRTVQTGFDDDTGEPIFESEDFHPETMPYIVVIVDEMADLMMVAGKEIEACIQRLAQMARASGIHLIMATQRPSVDVITGTIKANFPTRISFQVTSKIDSRTILGEMGAEQLLGMGDMLYMAGGGRITRVHGPFVSDEEVEEVVRHLKALGPPDYESGVMDGPEAEAESEIDLVLGLGGNTNGDDALYDQAVAIVAKDRKCSTSYIQRKLAIGYNKAARLVEQMEDEGVVSQANHVGKREVLVPER